jgi:hypothetical protein
VKQGVNDPMELTDCGSWMKDLYFLFISTELGWWQSLIKAGVEPGLLFLAIILSKEVSVWWWFPESSGWGTGTGMNGQQDPKGIFTKATAAWFWNWNQKGQGVPSVASLNAIINWVGHESGTAKMIYQTVFTSQGDNDSQYKDLSHSERLIELLNKDQYWNPDFIGITEQILTTDPLSVKGETWTWGNEPPSAHPDMNIYYQYPYENPQSWIYGPL